MQDGGESPYMGHSSFHRSDLSTEGSRECKIPAPYLVDILCLSFPVMFLAKGDIPKGLVTPQLPCSCTVG